ncbi:MAG: hypothetical protein U5L45_04150 [Saprospiraceae bacterium]|nr:hypothetical protein [Saprospiraceae bacterium]
MRALRSRKREETWFVFRRSRKTNHTPSLARAKRARDAKNTFRLCPSLNYLVTRSLRSRERGEVVHFSGKARKMNHISLFLRAKRAIG